MADLEKKIVIPVEADPKKADAQIDKLKKDAAKESVSIPVSIDIADITKALHAIQGMVGKMEKAFDKDVKFSGLQKGLDDVLAKFNSIMRPFNKDKPTEFQAIRVDLVGYKQLSDIIDDIRQNIKSLNNTKIDLNSFEKLYSIFEKIETLLNSIVKGMNFDNIRPSTQIQDEITKTTEKLDKLAKSEEKIRKIEKRFNRTARESRQAIAKSILEWGDSEGVSKETSLNNFIEEIKEYIKLGGDLSRLKFNLFNVETKKNELRSFAEVLEILQDEGKIDPIDASEITNDAENIKRLRQELSELNKELNDVQIRENRDLNVSLDTKSVEDFSKAIASAVEKIGELHFDIPEGFTLEGLSPENLDKIINKLEEIVVSIKNIGNVLTNEVDFSKVNDSLQDKETGSISLKIKPDIDAVAFSNEIEKQLKEAGFSFVKVRVEPLVDSIESFTNSIEDQLNTFGAIVKVNVKPNEVIQDNEENSLNNIEQKVRDIINAVNDKIDAFKNEEIQVKESSENEVQSLSKIKEKVSDISENNNLQLKLDSTEIYNEIDNIVKTINESIPDTKEIQIKFKEYKDTDILTDVAGEVITAYRGVQEAIGGMISDKQNGITFFSDRYDVAESYANRLHDGKEVDGKVYKTNLAMKNPLELDAKGSTWKNIKYLGDESDETSEKIIDLDYKIQNLRKELSELYNFDNLGNGFILDEDGWISQINEVGSIIPMFESIADYEKAMGKFSPMSLLDQDRIQAEKLIQALQQAYEEYNKISDAKDNIYGTHTTDEWANIARENGYDGIIIKNLYDAVGNTFKGEDSLSTIFAVFDSEQLKNTQVAKNNVEEIANAINRIDGNNVNDLSNAFKKLSENSTNTDTGTTGMPSEAEQAESLRQKIVEVTTAVDTKTRAFQEEEQVVVGTVQREISNLEMLEGQIVSIINEIKRLDDIKIQINLDGSKIDDSFITLLDNIKTKANDLPVETLSNLATALKELKVTSKTAENLEMVAVALSEFKDSLNGISSEGNEFLKLIGDITSRTDQLKDLAEVLKSTTKKIQEASEVTKKDDDAYNKGNSQGKKNKNYDAKANREAIEATNAAMAKLKHLSDKDIFSNAFVEASEQIKEVNTKLEEHNMDLTEYRKIVKSIQDELQKKAGVFKIIDPGDVENAKVIMDAYARQVSGNKAEIKSDYISKDNKKHIMNYQWIEEETGLVRNLTLTYDKLNGALYESSKAHKQAEKSGFKFSQMLKQGWMNVLKYVSSFVGFYEIWNAIRQGVSVIRELDTALTEMRKVSDESVSSLKNFQKASFDIANSVGATAVQIQNSTADWMRLGESINEAAKSAEVSNILLNVSEFESIDAATESLVSMAAAYDELDKIEIVDKLNIIGNNFAISTDGLATALKDSASALRTANNDIDEAVALATAANRVVQDPDKVGAGLRTIALRITGTEAAKAELEELGESVDDFTVTTTSKLNEKVMMLTKTTKEVGVSLLDMNGNYRSTYEIISDIADRWEDIKAEDLKTGENRQNALLEMLAGKNRSNILASMLESPDILKEAYDTSVNDSAGSAQKELDKYLNSIEGKIQKFQNNLQEFWYNLLDSDMVKQVVDAGTKLINVLGNVLSGITESPVLNFITEFLTGVVDLIDKLTGGLGKLSTVLTGVLGVGLYKKIKGKDSGGRAKVYQKIQNIKRHTKSVLIKYATEQVSREVNEL